MSGPFPGMDPYIENPVLWYGAHNVLITYMTAELNAILPSPYIASVEGRCYIERPKETLRPDVVVHRIARSPVDKGGGGTVALALVSAADEFEIFEIEVEEAYIDIVNVEDGARVVTSIELLSHTNKTSRDKGRSLYKAKQEKLLASDTHLVEIDLLRAGRHTVAIPRAAFGLERKYDYLACLHRAQTNRYTIWFNTLRDTLPTIAVPLDTDIADVPLSLQKVFNGAYDAGAYRRRIDYMPSPIPSLNAEDLAWADTLLREQGLRA